MKRVKSIQVKGFRGRSIEVVPDGKSILIEGKNGEGKSAVLEAIAYSVSGSVPGKPIPNNDALAAMSGPDGNFEITLTDTENGQIRRAFTGTKSIVRANFGERSTSAINEDHVSAISARYGAAISPLLLDSRKIVELSPNELRNVILRLCHEASPESRWTYSMVVDYLLEKIPKLGAENVVPDEVPNSEFDALRFLDALGRIFADETTECRRKVRELNTILNAEAPIERPNPEDISKLQNEVGKLEVELAEMQKALGGLEERKRQIEKGNEAAASQYRYSADYMSKAENAVNSAKATVEKYESSLARATNELTALEATNPEKAVPEVNSGDLFGSAQKAVPDTAFNEPEPVAPVDIEQRRAGWASKLSQMEADFSNNNAAKMDAAVTFATARGNLDSINQRIEKLSDGKCPTCGQSTEGIVNDLSDERTKLQTELDRASNVCEKYEARRIEIVRGIEDCRAGIAACDRESAEHDKAHAAWDERRKRAIADAANVIRNWQSQYQIKQQEVKSLANAVVSFRNTLAEAEKTYREALESSAHTEAIAMQEVPDSLIASIAEKRTDIDNKGIELAAVRDDLDRMTGAVTALAEFNRRQSLAETEKQAVQNRQKILSDATDLLPALLNLIVRQMVAPLVDRVNAFMPAHMGKFTVLFVPNFNVGLSRPCVNADGDTVEDHFTALRSLSTAESCIVLALMQRAFIALSGDSFPVVLIDNVEVMDEINWTVFKAFVTANADDMQVIAAGRRNDAVTYVSGLEITPLT